MSPVRINPPGVEYEEWLEPYQEPMTLTERVAQFVKNLCLCGRETPGSYDGAPGNEWLTPRDGLR